MGKEQVRMRWGLRRPLAEKSWQLEDHLGRAQGLSPQEAGRALAVPLARCQRQGSSRGMVQAPLPRGRPGEEALRGGEGGQGEVDRVDVHPLCRSKPSALCPPGCYPRCPKHRPIYDEELKACVTRDQCGCYIDNTHYTPGTPVPTGHICHTWYLSSRHRVLGRSAHTHRHARPFTRTHMAGGGGGPCCLCTSPRPCSAHTGSPGGVPSQPLGQRHPEAAGLSWGVGGG